MKEKITSGRGSSERGIALLAVVWTITLLFLVSLLLSQSVQTEVRAAIYRKEAARAYAAACGGVETAIFQIAYPPAADAPARAAGWTWHRGQREATVRLGEGRAEIVIVNEFGKVDLNLAGPEQFARLFEAHGLAAGAAADLARAIVHWRSPVSEHTEDVALDNFYRAPAAADSRPMPRHAPFVSVEEVLGVKGMTREIFFGTWEADEKGNILPKYGVGRDLTVLARSSQININFASEEVLRSVPGMGVETARGLIAERRRAPFVTLGEVGQRTAILVPAESLPYLTTAEGKTFSITATGSVGGSRVRRSVRAVVQLASQGSYRHRTVAWYDEATGE